jgi:hypothetical protein
MSSVQLAFFRVTTSCPDNGSVREGNRRIGPHLHVSHQDIAKLASAHVTVDAYADGFALSLAPGKGKGFMGASWGLPSPVRQTHSAFAPRRQGTLQH